MIDLEAEWPPTMVTEKMACIMMSAGEAFFSYTGLLPPGGPQLSVAGEDSRALGKQGREDRHARRTNTMADQHDRHVT